MERISSPASFVARRDPVNAPEGGATSSLFGATNRRGRAPRQRDTRLAMLAMLVFFGGFVVISAQIFDLFTPLASRVSLLTMLLVTAYYLRPPWKRDDLPILLAGGAVLIYLVIEHSIFVMTARVPANFNAVASYLPLVGFIPAYRARCSVTTLLRIFLGIVTAYLLIYTLGFHYFTTTVFDSTKAVVHTSDVDRGTRLYLASGLASFLGFYALSAKRLWIVARVVLMTLALVALYLSGYRTFSLIFVAVSGLAVLRTTGIAVRLGLFVVVMLVCAVVFWGVVDPLWNPFALFGKDGSASARAAEYVLALKTIFAHWLSGIGIASTFIDAQNFIGTPIWKALYPTDLGVLGPLITFGVPGLTAFIAMTLFAMVAPVRELGRPEVRALRLNGLACGINGIISPSILMEQNAIFFSLLLAIWLREQIVGRDKTHEPLFARSRGRWLEQSS